MEENRPLLERDIQTFLEGNIQLLGEDLTLVGREHPVPFGRIDLLAKDSRNRLVAIELKLGAANRDSVGQLQSYMGALQAAEPETFVRGVLVAKSLDAGAEAALRVARDIQFFSYALFFKFHREREGEDTFYSWLEQRTPKPPVPTPVGQPRATLNRQASIVSKSFICPICQAKMRPVKAVLAAKGAFRGCTSCGLVVNRSGSEVHL
jgi:hypothetical protein